jgi:hypothetical protein
MARKTRAQKRDEDNARWALQTDLARQREARESVAKGLHYCVGTDGLRRYFATIEEARSFLTQHVADHGIVLTADNYYDRQVHRSYYAIWMTQFVDGQWVALPDERDEVTFCLTYADTKEPTRVWR